MPKIIYRFISAFLTFFLHSEMMISQYSTLYWTPSIQVKHTSSVTISFWLIQLFHLRETILSFQTYSKISNFYAWHNSYLSYKQESLLLRITVLKHCKSPELQFKYNYGFPLSGYMSPHILYINECVIDRNCCDRIGIGYIFYL